jgi:hypothetical protein
MPPVNNTISFQNFLSGKLTADVTAGATDIFIDTVPSITQGFIVIDPLTPASREIIFFTSKTATKVSTPATGGRGVDGTSAVPHFNGTTYIIAPTAGYLTALQNGTASTDPIRVDTFSDFIIPATGVIAQSAGLIGTFSNIQFWLTGVKYAGTSIANKTYTASKDTYVDVTGNSDTTLTIQYNEVANGAAAPALSAGYIRVAKVVTSGAAITSVTQTGFDSLGNRVYPNKPIDISKLATSSSRFFNIGTAVSSQAGSTSMTDVTNGATVTIVLKAAATVRIIAGISVQGTTTSAIDMTGQLYDTFTSGAIGQQGRVTSAGGATFVGAPMIMTYYGTLAAGTHTIKMQVQGSGTSFNINGQFTDFIDAEIIG